MDGVASDACAGMHTRAAFRAMLNDGRLPRWAAKRGFQGVCPPGKKIPVSITLNGDSLISPSSVTGLTFTINNTNYTAASTFTLSGHTGQSYSGATTQFGDEQPFAGSVKLTRESKFFSVFLI